MGRQITLKSPLAPVALATRLKAVVPERVERDTPAGVLGRGTEAALTMWYYRPNFRNDLQTKFTATIEPDGAGSRIAGRIGAPRGAAVFFTLWFGFIGIFALIGLALLVSGAPWQIGAGFVAIPCLMAAIGGLICWLGLRNGRSDEAAILAFLAQAVDAHPI